MSQRTSKDTDGKYVRFVFNGDHNPGPLGLNTAKNTCDLIQIIELTMGDPDWEGARRHISRGKGP